MFTTAEESFLSQGVRCAARVYRPTDAEARPVIVMGHGFGGVRALRLYAYAERFAQAGYVVMAFDYRGFGESDGDPRQVLDIPMQLQDWRAALQFARTLPGADPQRVSAWGTSFGGGHVITLAGQGEPLAAIIAQVPHVSGPAAVRATGLRSALRLAPRALRDQAAALLGRAPVYVEAVGLPGTTAVMTTPDAVSGYERVDGTSKPVPPQETVTVQASCPSGKVPTGGGFQMTPGTQVLLSWPSNSSWIIEAYNASTTATRYVTAFAVCALAG